MKTLIAATAIMVSGILSTEADSYTVPLCGLTCLANSLDAGPAGELNRADHVIPYNDGDNIQVWTGVSWEVWSMDSLSVTGWLGPSGNDAPLSSLPVLGPGRGVFYGNNTGIPSITFTGTPRPSPIVVTVPVGLSCLGSPRVYGGPVSSVMSLPWPGRLQYPKMELLQFQMGGVCDGFSLSNRLD